MRKPTIGLVSCVQSESSIRAAIEASRPQPARVMRVERFRVEHAWSVFAWSIRMYVVAVMPHTYHEQRHGHGCHATFPAFSARNGYHSTTAACRPRRCLCPLCPLLILQCPLLLLGTCRARTRCRTRGFPSRNSCECSHSRTTR